MDPRPYASVLHLMDPELRAIVEKQTSVKQYTPKISNIKMIRKGFDGLTKRWHSAPVMTEAIKQCRSDRPWTEHQIKIPTRDGFQMPTKIYRPSTSVSDSKTNSTTTDKLAVMALIHGGGGCMGGLDTDEFICQLLCSKLNIIVVSIDYRLLPEVKDPVPALDTYDALCWIQTHAGKKGSGLEDVDLQKGFIGCGISAGGNLLGAALCMAAQRKLQVQTDKTGHSTDHSTDYTDLTGVLPQVSGVMMLMTGYPFQGSNPAKNQSINLYPDLIKSWKKFEDAPIVNKATVVDYVEMGQTVDLESPLHTLLNIPPDSPLLSHLTKRWYHQLGGLDMWRDSTLLWLNILLHSKTEVMPSGSREVSPSMPDRPCVKIDDYDGLPHTWWSVYPQVSKTREWLEDLVNGAKWALGDEHRGSGTSQLSVQAKL